MIGSLICDSSAVRSLRKLVLPGFEFFVLDVVEHELGVELGELKHPAWKTVSLPGPAFELARQIQFDHPVLTFGDSFSLAYAKNDPRTSLLTLNERILGSATLRRDYSVVDLNSVLRPSIQKANSSAWKKHGLQFRL